jgi:hypothetical protein
MSLQIKINTNERTRIDPANSDDVWDADDIYHDTTILSFSLSSRGGDIPVHFIPEVGIDYYLLYATYSTGDSFHVETGVVEYIGLYDDNNLAWKNYRALENVTEYSVILTAPNGLSYMQSVPWVGYFEHLTNLKVMKIQLKVDDY